MEILKQNELDKASKILKDGGLIAFPTETVFGLGVIFDNKESYDRLIKVKRRPPEKPFTLMCGKIEDVEKYMVLTDMSKKLVKSFMPGQFTLIGKAKEGLPSYVVSNEGNVGIRISNLKLVQDLINNVGKPLLVPSANKSGEPPLNNHKDVINVFDGEIDAVIEGESTSKTPSTIVIINGDDYSIIRHGLVSKEDIDKVLKGD